jgi:hypothetical protein
MTTDYLPTGFHLVETSAHPAEEAALKKVVSQLLEQAISSNSSVTVPRANLVEFLRDEAAKLYLMEPSLMNSESLTDPVMMLLEKAHSLSLSSPSSEFITA